MTLLALQHAFRDALIAEDFTVRAPFVDSAEAGLGVYRNAYRGRLMEGLRSSYDKVWTWVGDEAFDAAACHHIILHPPHSWTLDDYGAEFDQTLEAIFPDDPEVAELAWLERAMQNAFASLDEPVITPVDLTSSEMATCDWDSVQLDFVSSLKVREIRTNCTGIWLAIANETDPPEQIMLGASAPLCVWRKDLSPQFQLLDSNEWDALSLMASGATFGQLCQTLTEKLGEDEAVPLAGTLLGRWIGEAMVTAIRHSS
jgi:hypothetical protein